MYDFWVFPSYRGHNTGHECFAALENYTKIDGAFYYKLDAEKEKSIRFLEVTWLGRMRNDTRRRHPFC
ncbi:MAG: hypothetical protein ACOX3B_01630 [Bacilli bacterium]